MDYDAMDQYWIWLSAVEGMTPTRMYFLLDGFGDAQAVWDNISDACAMLPANVAAKLGQARKTRFLYELFAKLENAGARAITMRSDEYPETLKNIYDPPATIYAKGPDRLSDERMIAMVGSRTTSDDGKRTALAIAEGLASNGVTVVSGLARGIDTYSHIGCLNAREGKTVAVLGSGIDYIYPGENANLAARIIDSGGEIITEFAPGTRPYPGNFPARNRIISGLSRGVLMIEGKRTSGAVKTVDHALDQGKDVFAVPGSIYAVLSEGPNKLLCDGATPVLSEWDILEWYHWASRPDEGAMKKPSADLSGDEKRIVEMLRIQALSFNEMVNASGFNSAQLNIILTTLELKGIIKQSPGRIYRV
ncbi:MAG: DNA-processing protein DprA [Clostridia bacterium]|nr:DNA-processing protein DprA [Clostridia bacterium]